MTDKVVLSNRSALVAKYKASGEKAIRAAIQGLIAADRGRGLNTIYIAIDDAATMKKYKAQPVTKAANAGQNKKAVDAIYKKLAPDYIVLLGSVDVIPHQDLVNPVFNPRRPGDDDDRVIPSDLPYACETPYGTAVEKFTGPTRVVGAFPISPALRIRPISSASLRRRQRPSLACARIMRNTSASPPASGTNPRNLACRRFSVRARMSRWSRRNCRRGRRVSWDAFRISSTAMVRRVALSSTGRAGRGFQCLSTPPLSVENFPTV